MNIEDYHKIDNSLDQFEFKYKDIDVTYIVRNYVISLIRTNNNVGNPLIKLNSAILWRFLKTALMTFPSVFKKRSVWVFSNAERRKKFERYYYDRVASIVSEQNNDVLFIENPVIQNHKHPSKDTILSDAFFFIGSYLFSILKFKRKHLVIDPRFTDFAQEQGIKVNLIPLMKRFVGQYFFMHFFLRFISRPKMVYSVFPSGYYGYNYAFKQRRIPIIELQHGIIYPLHPSYNTILFEKSKKFKPDFVFTYGDKDKECLDSLNYVNKDNSFVVGSYGLWKGKNYTVIGDYLKSKLSINKKNVVIIATTNDIDELYQFSLKLISISNEFNLLLLPRHECKHLESRENVTILDIYKTNVFEVYKAADLLVSKSSTGALEALFMGIPCFLLEKENETSIFRQNYSFIKSFNFFQDEVQFVQAVKTEEYLLPLEEDVNQIYAAHVFENYDKALIKISNNEH
ncbi:hypothetical protein OHD16_26165 [Sphingobacterium sp. ML3W]|uniref:hypothetical protein n=1 Tax=Sphingobacterium sp. ML3W TaxID=1538644 RepID=UPI00249C4844|nr:hypothetical protein [Sphingobacterium sp. ML3W]WFA78192.1 hypothetical protein OGI71_19305 [Sphingobacterium sp. ML3W]